MAIQKKMKTDNFRILSAAVLVIVIVLFYFLFSSLADARPTNVSSTTSENQTHSQQYQNNSEGLVQARFVISENTDDTLVQASVEVLDN